MSSTTASEGAMAVGSRTVEKAGGSLRVTIPSDTADFFDLVEGDELRVGVLNSSEIAFHPAGVEFHPQLDCYAGNTTLVNHNGSIKAVIREEAVARTGASAGDSVEFGVSDGCLIGTVSSRSE